MVRARLKHDADSFDCQAWIKLGQGCGQRQRISQLVHEVVRNRRPDQTALFVEQLDSLPDLAKPKAICRQAHPMLREVVRLFRLARKPAEAIEYANQVL